MGPKRPAETLSTAPHAAKRAETDWQSARSAEVGTLSSDQAASGSEAGGPAAAAAAMPHRSAMPPPGPDEPRMADVPAAAAAPAAAEAAFALGAHAGQEEQQPPQQQPQHEPPAPQAAGLHEGPGVEAGAELDRRCTCGGCIEGILSQRNAAWLEIAADMERMDICDLIREAESSGEFGQPRARFRRRPLDPSSPLFQACPADSLKRLPLATQQHELFKTFLQGAYEAFDTIACLLQVKKIPYAHSVLLEWQKEHWSGAARDRFLERGGSLSIVLNHTFREAEAMANNPPFEDPLELPPCANDDAWEEVSGMLFVSCIMTEQMRIANSAAAMLAEWGPPQPVPLATAEQRRQRVQGHLADLEQLVGQWEDPGLQEFYGKSSTLAKVAHRRVMQRAAQQAQQ